MDFKNIKKGEYSIGIDSEGISAKLTEFKQEMIKMEALQDAIIFENNAMKKEWQGSASEEVLNKIDGFRESLESIKAQNQKYVNELNKIIDRYADEQKNNIDTVSNNVSSYDFTWQKGA